MIALCRPIRTAPAVAGLALSLLFALPCAGRMEGQGTRSINGMVTDQHHEPLGGAIVYVENDATQAVLTFLTDRAGHFEFKHLSPDSDYHVWAAYREQRSRRRFLSHFDSKTSRTLRFEVRLR